MPGEDGPVDLQFPKLPDTLLGTNYPKVVMWVGKSAGTFFLPCPVGRRRGLCGLEAVRRFHLLGV